MIPPLKVCNLTKTYSSGGWPFSRPEEQTVVDNISFEVKKGEILGILGPNGAGKTTTIQMLLGTLTPTSGSISYFGTDFTDHRVSALRHIGYTSGYERLPGKLTVSENLDLIGHVCALSPSERAAQIELLLKQFGMWEMRDMPTGALTTGQATRTMLVKAFIAAPEFVLLDEPTASLDPEAAYEVRRFILAERSNRNASFLIASHNMEELSELCDRVLVFKKGTIIADNTPEQLAKSISKVRIQLTFSPALLTEARSFLGTTGLAFTAQGTQVVVGIDEHNIARFLTDISIKQLCYSHISITKPTLEDYFLSIAK